MPKLLHSQKSFNSGAISPRLYGRTDSSIYTNGLETAENVVLGTEGHIRKRNGSQFIAETGNSAAKSRLIPFQYSQTQSVVLEFGDETIRFFADKAQIESGGSPYEIVSPYTESDLPNITYAQFANVLYIACKGITARKLTRNGETNWTLEEIPLSALPIDILPTMAFEMDGSLTVNTGDPTVVNAIVNFVVGAGTEVPKIRHRGMEVVLRNGRTGRGKITTTGTNSLTIIIIDPFDSATALTSADYSVIGTVFCEGISGSAYDPQPSATYGAITVTGCGENSADDVGRTLAINGGECIVTATSGSLDLTCQVTKLLESTNVDESARFIDKSGQVSQPQVVGIYDQRLVWGNDNNSPQSVWLSQFQDFSDFEQGINSNDGMRVDVGFGQYSEITWLASSNDLLIGSARVESSVRGNNGVLTPTNADSIQRASIGSALQVPVQVDNETLFISNANRVYSIRYNFEVNNYVPNDLSQIAEHLTNDGLGEMTYAKRPDKTIHVVTNAGDIMVGTFSREEQVIGWSLYSTDGSYESVTSIRESGVDQVWVVVNRTIDGSTVRYVEVFDQGSGTSGLDGFSDSYLTYSGTATATLTGLDHLEGETVEIKIDNGTHVSKTVSSGSITLDTETTTATVGMPYTMTIKTLPIEKQLLSDSIQGQQASWVEPILRVYNSAYPTVNGHVKTLRVADNSNMDEGPTLATGFVKYGNVDSSTLTITDTGPLPVFINSIQGEIEVGV